MPDINLDAMTLKELQSLQKAVAKAIETYEYRVKSEARSKVEALARELGFALADFASGESAKPKRAPAEAKFRHPENPEITWSGRGRKPRWYADHVNAGKDPKELAA